MSFIQDATHGVTEQYVINDDYDYVVEEIHFKGYSVIPGVIDSERINNLLKLTDDVYEIQKNEIGEENLRKMKDENNVRAPLCYRSEFIDLAAHPVLINVAKRIFGDNFVLLQQNGIINVPVVYQYQTRWHRDLSYQHWTSTKPIAINALFCLTEFNEKTGGTYVLPNTHLNAVFPSEQYVKKHEVCMNASAGSLILMNAMLYHRAGNNTSDKPRVGINHVIGLPFIAQQINYSACLNVEDEFLKKYLGFRWAPASSPSDYRKKRI